MMYEINSFIYRLSPIQKFGSVIMILGIIISILIVALMKDLGMKEDRWRPLAGALVLLVGLFLIIFMDRIIGVL